jgi:hypothetical protein
VATLQPGANFFDDWRGLNSVASSLSLNWFEIDAELDTQGSI